jgi:FKBP-type peptidyl-prolyl cis-trans isomerase
MRGMVRRVLLAFGLIGALLLAGAPRTFAVLKMVGKNRQPITATLSKGVRVVSLKDGLKYQDLVVGEGARPRAGQTVTVAYIGLLKNGTMFDSSIKHGGKFKFVLGRGKVIKGWDEGVKGMRVGGERKLFVPPALGYGSAGHPPAVPPNSPLVFTVDLMGVK